MKNLKNKGFTLAETMIVLVILGVVAAITVPALVNRHVEAERRTKLKKAMSVYDTALNKMVIENGIKSDTALTNWADSNTKNDCANTSAYFKVARNLEVNGNATNCKFRASDGVFWDISDIKKPLIALREQDLNAETAQSDTNRAFYMFGWFDENGSLRSNDMGKISATDKADLQKLYDFIAGKSTTSMGEIESTPEPEPEEEISPITKLKSDLTKIKNGEYNDCATNINCGNTNLMIGQRANLNNNTHNCKSCKQTISIAGGMAEYYLYYDSNGNIILDDYEGDFRSTIYSYDENGNLRYKVFWSGCEDGIEGSCEADGNPKCDDPQASGCLNNFLQNY